MGTAGAPSPRQSRLALRSSATGFSKRFRRPSLNPLKPSGPSRTSQILWTGVLRTRGLLRRTGVLGPAMGPAQWAWGWILRRLDTSPAVETKVRLPNGLIFDIPPRTHFYWDLSTGLYEKEVVDLIEGFL